MERINFLKIVAVSFIACFSFLTLVSCASKPKTAAVTTNNEELYWLDDSVPSFYKTYKDYFDYVGFSCVFNEFTTSEIGEGFYKHSNTTTMGNELKPDFIFNWGWGSYVSNLTTYTDSNGTTIEVPSVPLTGFRKVDQILGLCQLNNIKMRGHVLVWHSQTPEEFFREGYKSSGALVDKATMTARQEWYIKTVIEHVQEWEKKYNKGEHIIWAWDVVNEAVQDGSMNLRSDSNWYRIYGSSEFVVNAFRFANKYAAPDVLLCYNDYGETNRAKRMGMCKLIDDIQAASNDEVLPSRIDVMGLQSHISINTNHLDYQLAIVDFVNKGLDVHVTELDVATESSYNPEALRNYYKTLFKLLINCRKTEDNHGVTCVTIWGINDEGTWLNSPSQIKWHGNVTQYPLLFTKKDGKITTKPAYFGVIEAAGK